MYCVMCGRSSGTCYLFVGQVLDVTGLWEPCHDTRMLVVSTAVKLHRTLPERLIPTVPCPLPRTELRCSLRELPMTSCSVGVDVLSEEYRLLEAQRFEVATPMAVKCGRHCSGLRSIIFVPRAGLGEDFPERYGNRRLGKRLSVGVNEAGRRRIAPRGASRAEGEADLAAEGNAGKKKAEHRVSRTSRRSNDAHIALRGPGARDTVYQCLPSKWFACESIL